ncbi:hypothetical protein CW304_23905 [Bacillus sp. UFRGS-B20]|nr:hypothetical protein CW304_23905 [Bacillus sp. UFRGS-B20]
MLSAKLLIQLDIGASCYQCSSIGYLMSRRELFSSCSRSPQGILGGQIYVLELSQVVAGFW